MRLALFLVCAMGVGVGQSVAPAQPQPPMQGRQVWEMQDSGTNAGLRGIDSVDGTVAWASGTGGTVLRTTDGGAHWQRCATPDAGKDGATLDFRGVQAWDAETAFVMSSGKSRLSRLYKTIDGCMSWTTQFTNPDEDGFWDALMMDIDYELFILGDPVGGRFVLFSQAPGGKWSRNWNGHDIVAQRGEVAFAASNSVLIEGGQGGFCFVTGGSKTEIIHEIHGIDLDKGMFSDWVRMPLPLAVGDSAGAFSISSIQFSGGSLHNSFVVVGGDYKRPGDSIGTAAFSSDWGETWTASTIPPHGFRSAVQWSEALKAWITVGTNGSDISRDDGKTWQPLDDGNWNALSLPFVVGPNGRIARLNAQSLSPAGGP
ncbi:MAG: glycosyl hydrolase [Terracidiphilus sp.]